MTMAKLTGLFIVPVVLLLANLSAGTFEKFTKPVDAYHYQAALRVGIDVDWAKTAAGRIAAQHSHRAGINVPSLFKARGFDHVRIRIKGNVLNDKVDSRTGMRLLDEIKVLVDDCLKAGITPILAYRLDDFKNMPESDERLAAAVAWWKKIAVTFKDYPYNLAYDLVIEPSGKIKRRNDRLNLFYARTIEAIRRIDHGRIVIVAANRLSSPYELTKLRLPRGDRYIMAEWHFYAAGPQRDNPRKNWTSGTAREKKLITDKITFAKNWSEQHGVPTWVGAWMPNNYNMKGSRKRVTADGAPDGGNHSLREQLAFAEFMSRSLQQAGIPYAINSDTKYFNRQTNQWYLSRQKLLDTILKHY